MSAVAENRVATKKNTPNGRHPQICSAPRRIGSDAVVGAEAGGLGARVTASSIRHHKPDQPAALHRLRNVVEHPVPLPRIA